MSAPVAFSEFLFYAWHIQMNSVIFEALRRTFPCPANQKFVIAGQRRPDEQKLLVS